jgi:cytochrome c2
MLIAVAIIGVAAAASAAPPDAAQGEKVFAEQKCGLCHSIAGKKAIPRAAGRSCRQAVSR